jgi:hypothetical protein
VGLSSGAFTKPFRNRSNSRGDMSVMDEE